MTSFDISQPCIVFKIGKWHFVVPNKNARLVLRRNELGAIQALPDMAPPVVGVTNIQGHARVLLDIGLLFNCADDGKKNAIVLGSDKEQSAVLIDNLPWSLKNSEYINVGLDSMELPIAIKSWCLHGWRPLETNNPWLLHLRPIEFLFDVWQ